MPPAPETGPARRDNAVLRALVYAAFAWGGLIVLSPVFYFATDTLITFVAATFAAAAIANWICLRIWERRGLAEVGLGWNRAAARHLLFGLAGGAAAAALAVVPFLLTGLARWTPAAGERTTPGTFLFYLVILLFGVVGEELLFRGYGFQILVRRFGVWATLLPMGVLFAAAHSGNLNVTRLALFNTFLWGVALGWCVLRSGDLWLATGVHAGWNWALPLLGVNLSGFTMRVTGVELQWSLGPLWSGGDYGPEGGLLCTMVLAALLAFLRRAPIERQTLALADASVQEGGGDEVSRRDAGGGGGSAAGGSAAGKG
jgi:membrane protease YdiL (CAAX protease family)